MITSHSILSHLILSMSLSIASTFLYDRNEVAEEDHSQYNQEQENTGESRGGGNAKTEGNHTSGRTEVKVNGLNEQDHCTVEEEIIHTYINIYTYICSM